MSGIREVLSAHKMVMLSAQQGRCRGEKGPMEGVGQVGGQPRWKHVETLVYSPGLLESLADPDAPSIL